MDKITQITNYVVEVNKMKMTAASLNIANSDAQSNTSADVYKEILIKATGTDQISNFLKDNKADLSNYLDVNYIENTTETKRYMPNSPYADSMGFVYSSNIDHTKQMLDVQNSKRTYESALKIYQMHMDMNSAILRIGK
jgi:flagellar basal-body rod protein FlgC